MLIDSFCLILSVKLCLMRVRVWVKYLQKGNSISRPKLHYIRTEVEKRKNVVFLFDKPEFKVSGPKPEESKNFKLVLRRSFWELITQVPQGVHNMCIHNWDHFLRTWFNCPCLCNTLTWLLILTPPFLEKKHETFIFLLSSYRYITSKHIFRKVFRATRRGCWWHCCCWCSKWWIPWVRDRYFVQIYVASMSIFTSFSKKSSL